MTVFAQVEALKIKYQYQETAVTLLYGAGLKFPVHA